MPQLELNDLTLTYKQQMLFDNFNLAFEMGLWSSLLGPSGTGKTTILRLLAGLSTGGVLSKTSRIFSPKHEIAYLSQQNCLLPWLTALENVLLGYQLRSKLNKEIKQQAIELLERVGLADALHKKPTELSGGMQQRVALARTLLENKPIILLDEPFSALDVITKMKLQTLAADLLRDKTVILVTHDPLEALRLSHHIFILAGEPARITKQISLESIPPRHVHEPNLLTLQAELLDELSEAALK